MNELQRKTVAVGSGKGGVGKTTTAVNLALLCASRGLRTALVDTDPFSNVATTLDIDQRRIDPFAATFSDEKSEFEKNRLRAFAGLDIVFPAAKLDGPETAQRISARFRHFSESLEREYDVVILDLPAGNTIQAGNDILEMSGGLLLVTNAEPTSHVASGAYLKDVLSSHPGMPVFLWHNKYRASFTERFDPADLIGNYNRNVPDDERILDGAEVRDLAFIPEDRAMDLLQSSASVAANARMSVLDVLQAIQGEYRRVILGAWDLSPARRALLQDFLSERPSLANEHEAMTEFTKYLSGAVAASPLAKGGGAPLPRDLFTPEEESSLTDIFTAILSHSLGSEIRRAITFCQRSLEQLTPGLFADATPGDPEKDLTRSLSVLLGHLAKVGDKGDIKRLGRLLLFRFTVLKSFESKSLTDMVKAFIPRRRDRDGRIHRDKHRQIQRLVRKDDAYQRSYFALVKKLYPVFMENLKGVVKALEVPSLLFLDKDGKAHQRAYLQLLTDFLHNAINSGLGVILGFRFRAASRKFTEAGTTLIDSLKGR